MAGTYSLGVQSVAAASGAGYATLHTVSTKRARIRELGIFVNAATASSIGLGRPANTPVATTSILGLAEDSADVASTVNLDSAWSTPPTAPTQFLRRTTIPATIGNGIIWTWGPSELIVPVSAWLVLWNFGAGAGSVLNYYFKWDE